MAKIPMRVILAPLDGSREVRVARNHAGAMAVKGIEGATTFLCGGCRSILVKCVGPDAAITHGPEDENGDFPPIGTVREAVFECKSCGAFNEVA